MEDSKFDRSADTIVSASGFSLQYEHARVLDDIEFNVSRGESWLIGGESGSGKSSLGKVIAGVIDGGGKVCHKFDTLSRLPAMAYFVDNWYKFANLEGDRNFYYQQRYNKQEKNETLTVYAQLKHFGKEYGLDFARVETFLQKFGFEECEQTQLIELSSGEHKKLQLVMALWLNPQLLVLDEPYTGLDSLSRDNLNDILDTQAKSGSTIILISNNSQIPSAISKFARIENMKISICQNASDLLPRKIKRDKPVPYFLQKFPEVDSQKMIDVKNVTIKYGDKEVLKNINWSVNAGEKWALQGKNGSGKSTLLSLLDGDHPQAYANDICLFGKKRGSGESIWDIKEKIGIISPEMHWFFDPNATVWHTIASGFHDSIGWFLKVSDEEARKMTALLDFFDLAADKDKLLNILPIGKQRLALLARTMIKNPQLLILDEPCQGLDSEQTALFNSILDELSVYGKTIIYVGHYQSQMPSCIDHKLILEKGEVIKCGACD